MTESHPSYSSCLQYHDSEGAKDHLRLIAELAGKLGNDETMKKLQTAKTYEELLEAFS